MDVPHPGRCRGRGIKVPFYKDGACLRTLRGYEHVAPFDGSDFVRFADLDDRDRVAHVGECAAAAHDRSVGFTDDPGTRGNVQRVRDKVRSSIEEDDRPTSGGRHDGSLQSRSVVRSPVTCGACCADADEGRRAVRLVLRLGALVEVGAGNETGRPAVWRYGVLNRLWAIRRVGITLTPPGNGEAAASEECTTRPLNGSTDVVQHDILEDHTAACRGSGAKAASGGNADFCIADYAVDHNHRANRLSAVVQATDTQRDLAVFDGDSLVRPAPVPQLIDGRDGIIKCEIARCELLIAPVRANITAVEDKVGHEAT